MSAREPVLPQFYVEDTGPIDRASAGIRFEGVVDAAMMRRLAQAWTEIVPEQPFRAQTAQAGFEALAQADRHRAQLFSIAATLASVIACIGLHGLAAFSTTRRLHEVGIRKTLGASTGAVLLLLVRQLLRPVLSACAIGCPVAWIVMRGWLAGFDQRIGLSPLYFMLAGGVVLGLATLTVLGQSWRVARAEPALALGRG